MQLTHLSTFALDNSQLIPSNGFQLKFLHLSDLHFTTDTAGTVFDHDLKIREALLDDLGKNGRENYQGIFVTGDVAYHGRADEFARASTWLEDVRKKTASAPEAIFVVPGNHDVNRTIVGEGSSLWSQQIEGFPGLGVADHQEQVAPLVERV